MSTRQRAYDPNLVEIKAKFECEFRRFSVDRLQTSQFHDFHSLVKDSHHLPTDMPFTISYTDPRNGDLLPINNDDNMLRAFSTALPLLRIFVYREQDLMRRDIEQREKRGKKAVRSNIAIGAPVDFRVVSGIVDADLLPDTVRRVKLLKHSSDRPLGFYIRDGTSVRVTAHGLEKVPGIFISRLVPNGLAEGTGLLAVNDEILEVNGIEVVGKSLDQVTDMMVANSQNLIITVKPATDPPSTPQTQHLSLTRSQKPAGSASPAPSGARSATLPPVSPGNAGMSTPTTRPSHRHDANFISDLDTEMDKVLKLSS